MRSPSPARAEGVRGRGWPRARPGPPGPSGPAPRKPASVQPADGSSTGLGQVIPGVSEIRASAGSSGTITSASTKRPPGASTAAIRMNRSRLPRRQDGGCTGRWPRGRTVPRAAAPQPPRRAAGRGLPEPARGRGQHRRTVVHADQRASGWRRAAAGPSPRAGPQLEDPTGRHAARRATSRSCSSS